MALEVIRLHCLKRTEAAPMMMGAEASNIAAFSYTAPADCCRRRYGIRYKRRTVRKILTANIPQMQGSQPSLPGFPHRHNETSAVRVSPSCGRSCCAFTEYGFIYMVIYISLPHDCPAHSLTRHGTGWTARDADVSLFCLFVGVMQHLVRHRACE